MSDELNEMVGDLLNQLNDAQQVAKKVEKENNPLKKENLEKFVVERAGTLVEESLAMLQNVKDYIVSAPENKDVAAFSDLVAATSSAIETLNKILMSDKKNETIVQVKKMDIDSRRELKQEDTSQKLLATREEVFKMLMNNVKVAEKQVIEIEPELPNS
jgi:hypothetical protein